MVNWFIKSEILLWVTNGQEATGTPIPLRGIVTAFQGLTIGRNFYLNHNTKQPTLSILDPFILLTQDNGYRH
jgi:hypothetical protein